MNYRDVSIMAGFMLDMNIEGQMDVDRYLAASSMVHAAHMAGVITEDQCVEIEDDLRAWMKERKATSHKPLPPQRKATPEEEQIIRNAATMDHNTREYIEYVFQHRDTIEDMSLTDEITRIVKEARDAA